MVWLASQDLVGPEELLEQDDSGELVWKRDRAEREQRVRPFLDAGSEAERATQYEAQVVARLSPPLEESSDVHARECLSPAIERAHEAPLRNPSQEGQPLTLEQLRPAPGIAPRLLELCDLDSGVAADQALVVGHIVCERRAAQGADADDQDAHGGILGE
jgi:hypothetical protein